MAIGCNFRNGIVGSVAAKTRTGRGIILYFPCENRTCWVRSEKWLWFGIFVFLEFYTRAHLLFNLSLRSRRAVFRLSVLKTNTPKTEQTKRYSYGRLVFIFVGRFSSYLRRCSWHLYHGHTNDPYMWKTKFFQNVQL